MKAKKLALSAAICAALMSTQAVVAAEPVYNLEGPAVDEATPISLNIPVTDSLEIGQEISVSLPDGQVLQGEVTKVLDGPGVVKAPEGTTEQEGGEAKVFAEESPITKTWIVTLPENAGSLEIGEGKWYYFSARAF